jgi:putative ABC transport system permease protein
MLQDYLKTAFRVLLKNKFFSIVNIISLTLGITTCLLILIYIENELSYEKFQKNRDNIYRVTARWGQEGNVMKFAGSMPAIAPAVMGEVPEVENAIRIKKAYDATFKNRDNNEINEENVFYSEQGIFSIFSIDLREGNPATVLTDPYSVALSEKMAVKYFGSEDPIGKELTINKAPFKITGIFSDIPDNTHLKFEFILSYPTLKAMGKVAEKPWNSWGDELTYLLIKNGSDPSKITPQLNGLVKKNAGDWFAGQMKLDIQPLSEIHWDTSSRGDIGPKGNRTYIFIFMSAAFFVLLIACSNFLNLSISQYLGRLKEVGIRRTFGALRKQLLFQFLTESMLIILVSSILAALLFDSLHKNLYSYLGTSFVMGDSYFMALALTVISIIIVVGLIAGGYPALFISRFNPVVILKKEVSTIRKRITARKLLVMFQFSISIILITGTLIIFRQLDYMKNSDLGFKKENVILVNSSSLNEAGENKYELLRDELLKNTNISYVSGAYTLPGINSQMNIGVRPDGSPDNTSIVIQALPGDFSFVESMGLRIIDGRDFSRDLMTDKTESVLLNEAAVKALALEKPVGKKLYIPGEDTGKGSTMKPVTIIGIVKNFHVRSFQESITPMLIFMKPKMYMYMAIRLAPGKLEETKKYIKDTWTAVTHDGSPDIKYLDDVYNKIYTTEEKTGRLLTFFTGLALFITCLGLFGFSSFTISKRYKEVGIRKVLGISLPQLTLLLSGEITLWILVSGVIACPFAYIIISKWLDNFVYHISFGWIVYITAIGAELLITLITIGWLTLKAATRNPVEALRYE